ncbi:MAG: flagellar basal body P-ring formation chaperone FlgA [Chlorobiota bacterium]
MKVLINILLLFCFVSNLSSATFSADRIKEACSIYVHSTVNSHYNVKFKSEFEDIIVDGENIKAIFDDDYSKYNSAVKLDFVSGDEIITSFKFEYELTQTLEIFRAIKYIPANTKIDNSMVQKITKEVPVEKVDQYKVELGFVASKPIYKQQELDKNNLLPDVTIKRGEEVVVIATAGAVTIRGLATALQDGRVGERIRVKRENSKKVLNGKINESGELVLGE